MLVQKYGKKIVTFLGIWSDFILWALVDYFLLQIYYLIYYNEVGEWYWKRNHCLLFYMVSEVDIPVSYKIFCCVMALGLWTILKLHKDYSTFCKCCTRDGSSFLYVTDWILPPPYLLCICSTTIILILMFLNFYGFPSFIKSI